MLIRFPSLLTLAAVCLLSVPGCSGDSADAVTCGPGTRLDGSQCVVDILPPGGSGSGGVAGVNGGGQAGAPGGAAGIGEAGKGNPGGMSVAGQNQGGAGSSQGGAGGAGSAQAGAGQSQGGAGSSQGGAGQSQGEAGSAQAGAGQNQGGAGSGQGGAGQSQGGAGSAGSADGYVHPAMCQPDGGPPVVVPTPPLPPITLAVNGVLSCSNQPPPMQNAYTDGELLFYWCSSDANANNETFVARLFDAGGGLVIPWLEEHHKDGSTGFGTAPNFISLVPGQINPVWDLLSFASQDPRPPVGWRPPAPEVRDFKEGDLIIDWAPQGRKFVAHVTDHGTVEAIDNDGKFTVPQFLHNVEDYGLKPNQWMCFAECRTNDDCAVLMYPPSYSCVPEKGRCLP